MLYLSLKRLNLCHQVNHAGAKVKVGDDYKALV